MLGRKGSGTSISPQIVELYKTLSSLNNDSVEFDKVLSQSAINNLSLLSDILQNGHSSGAIIQMAYPEDGEQPMRQTSLAFPNMIMSKKIEEYISKSQTESQVMQTEL